MLPTNKNGVSTPSECWPRSRVRDLDLTDLAERLAAEPEDVLGGLHVLDAMALITTEESNDGPRFHLRALPDEHVRFVGPNGRAQWLFVARPLDPPDVDSASLN